VTSATQLHAIIVILPGSLAYKTVRERQTIPDFNGARDPGSGGGANPLF